MGKQATERNQDADTEATKTATGGTSAPTEWVCWTLYREDIDYIACKRNLDIGSLDEGDIDLVARRFKKGFDWSLQDWEDMLAEAIVLVLRGKEPPNGKV